MAETLYTIVNVLVLPPWLLLIAAPRWKWTLPLTSVVYPGLLGLTYMTLVAFNLHSLPDGFASLDHLARLFDNPNVLLVGWVHYLAFDLFVGSWQVRDARRRNIPHGLLIPCLLLTLLLGPTGLVCYFVLRGALRGPQNRGAERRCDRTGLLGVPSRVRSRLRPMLCAAFCVTWRGRDPSRAADGSRGDRLRTTWRDSHGDGMRRPFAPFFNGTPKPCSPC